MKKYKLLYLLPVFTGLIVAQQNPAWSSYVGGLMGQMAAIWNSVSTLPQSKIAISGQLTPVMGGTFTYCDPTAVNDSTPTCAGVPVCDPSVAAGGVNACTFNNSTVPNAYLDGLKRLGITAINANVDPEVFVTASQYISSSATHITTTNCAGLCDGNYTGPYTGLQRLTYIAQVDGTAVAGCSNHDTFKWGAAVGDIAGVTFGTTGVCMTGSGTKQTLSNGIQIAWAANVGHTIGDQFIIKAIPTAAALPYWTNSLTNTDTWMAHAAAIGTIVRLRPAPSNNLNIDLGFDASSTVLDLIAGMLPLYAAAMTRYNGVGGVGSFASFHVFHEPTANGIWGKTLPWTPSNADYNTFLTQTGAAINALATAESLGTKVGADFLDNEGGAEGASVANAQLAIVGIDLEQANGCTIGNYKTSDWDQLAIRVTTAHNNGKIAMITESHRPFHCPTGTPSPHDSDSYEGCGHFIWGTPSGANVAWFQGVLMAASGLGITEVSAFNSMIFFWLTTDLTHDTELDFSPAGYYALTIPHLTETSDLGFFAKNRAFKFAAMLTGNSKITTKAKIGN